MYQELRSIAEDAKEHGLAVVVWAYPRGSSISKAGETAVDVVAYAAQIAAQARRQYNQGQTSHGKYRAARGEEGLRRGQDSAGNIGRSDSPRGSGRFDGRRIVIFSGGAKESDEQLLTTVRGSTRAAASARLSAATHSSAPSRTRLSLLGQVIDIYKS